MNLVTGFTEDELRGVSVDVRGEYLIKTAVTEIEGRFLRNEFRLLNGHMQWSGFTPQVSNITVDRDKVVLVEEYLGPSQAITDEIVFRRNCARLLGALRHRGVVHGDLTSKNIVVRHNAPYAVDFHQSRLVDEPGPDKRPVGDGYHLWAAAEQLSPDTSRHIRKWRAIRPHIDDALVVDYGCAEGDYCLFASVDSNVTSFVGFDRDGVAVDVARSLLGAGSGAVFHKANLSRIEPVWGGTAFFMSVYAHMVRDIGRSGTENFLSRVLASSGKLFFETQLAGDGPGPDYFQMDSDVKVFLERFGTVKALATIPVHGRSAARTVWMVTA